MNPQKLQQFFLIGNSLMVLFLVRNICYDMRNNTFADTKRAVS